MLPRSQGERGPGKTPLLVDWGTPAVRARPLALGEGPVSLGTSEEALRSGRGRCQHCWRAGAWAPRADPDRACRGVVGIRGDC